MGEIGSRLVRAREARGLTLEDAERDTRISRRYLEALESEQFEVIPAPVYARGFLRSYSQYLGMDPQELLLLFPRGDEAPGPAAPPPRTPQPAKATMDTPIPPTSASRPQWRKPPRFDAGKAPRMEPRPRRREAPPPQPPGLGERAAELAPQEFVIGGEVLEVGSVPETATAVDVTPPAALPREVAAPPARLPRQARKPTLRATTPAAPPAQEVVIGDVSPVRAAPQGGPARSQADKQRNLVVLGAMGAILLIVVIAAFLISSLGGDEGGIAPTTTATGTVTAGAASTTTGTAPTRTGTATTQAATQGVVPDVVGETEADATRLVRAAGLAVRVITEKSTRPKGTVTDQSPAPTTQLQAGDEVTIVVSEGP
ncbi:MAG: helix-turn-helix domain-containing protein [Dehalococcoidia bacterium]